MSTITLRASDFQGPVAATDPVVYIRANWLDEWVYVPWLEFNGGMADSAGHGLGKVQFRYEYGAIRHAWETTRQIYLPQLLTDYWVKLDFLDGTVAREAWVGRILQDDRSVTGVDTYGGVTHEVGVQNFTAYAGKYLLDKTEVATSFWNINGAATEVGHLPSMNLRDENDLLKGNRSSIMIGGSYVFGGSDEWSNFDLVKYLLNYHASNVPGWYLGGQANLLKNIYNVINWPASPTLGQMLDELIPLDMGVDYHIFHGNGSFFINVYATNGIAYSFDGVTLPHNPNQVIVEVPTTTSEVLEVRVEKNTVKQYSTLKVIGKRPVICASPPLEGKWTAAKRAGYLVAAGGSSDTERDLIRSGNYFEDVYQLFGAPAGWTMSKQSTVRETLTWLPLREGFDYSDGGIVDHNPDNHEPDQLRPMAWVWDETYSRYVPAQSANINISIPKSDWGVRLEPYINHLLGLNDFWDESDPSFNSDYAAVYDPDKVVATIAFLSDDRLTLEYRAAGGDGSVKYLDAPEMEKWLLAPYTAVGVDQTTGALEYSGSSWRVLRNDADGVAMKMAGGISEFIQNRASGIVTVNRYLAAAPLIGCIMTFIAGPTDTPEIQAPITSVEWADNQTIIRTGFAQSGAENV